MTVSEFSYAAAPHTAFRPGHALAVAGAVGPTLSVFAYKGLAPLFFLVAIAELLLFWRQHRTWPRVAASGVALMGAFVIWGVIGSLWSLESEASLATAGKLALMAVLGLPLLSLACELDSKTRRLALRASHIGLAAGLAVMTVEVFLDQPITHALYTLLRLPHLVYPSMLNPAATVLVLVAAIAAGDLLGRKRIVWALAIGGAAIVLAVVSESMAAGLAGVAAAVVFPAVYWGGARLGRILAVIAALSILAAPLLPTRILGPAKEFNWPAGAVASVYQRIAIWQFTETRIDQRPILGWGLDAARRIPGGHDGIKAESLHVQNPVMRAKVARYFASGNIEQMPLHPHNAALQIWLEAGAVGAILTAILVFVALWAIARRSAVNRSGAAASFAFSLAALLIAGLSYGIWQTWWLATLWLAAMMAELVMSDQVLR